MSHTAVPSRVRTKHTPDEAERITRCIAEAWPVSVGITAEATLLVENGARFQEWSVDTTPGEPLADMVARLLAPGDGYTFGEHVDGYGDEQLVEYVLEADPEHLNVSVHVCASEDDYDKGVAWEVTARPGDSFADLVALVVAAARAAR
ncbi:hypothetical protein [Embleya sp. NPDC020886]|uniref:hypothetical protein n=1 Tax=Embleya sp. NPDC020886 TaxID=3363980 RepID=UPI0037A02946